MRVFVTGATGFIGSAVVRELIERGHQVLGLARSDDGAQAVAAAGAEVHRGDINDLDSLRSGAARSDGVIHTAYNHDFSQFSAAAETDLKAVNAMGEVLAGTGKALVISSGTAIVGGGTLITEVDLPLDPGGGRGLCESAVVGLAENGVRGIAIRLPPPTHDRTKFGLISLMIATAKQTGVSAYVGDGANRWPSVHQLDAAHLYCLAVEKGTAGARYHAVAEQGVPLRSVAEVIARRLGLPLVVKPAEEAMAHFGFVGMFVGVDCPTSADWTRETLDWHPTHAGLLDDLEHATVW